jgi:chromosome segregation ATPase
MTLLQTEKRLMDLEMGLSELREKFKDIDPKKISEIAERVEELEDLILVEQAGIIELKRALEGFGTSKETEEKIKSLENMLTQTKDEMKTKIENILVMKPRIEEMIEKVDKSVSKMWEEVEKKLKEISDKRIELEVKIQNLAEKVDKMNFEPLEEEIKKVKENFFATSARLRVVENLLTKIISETEAAKPLMRKIETIEKLEDRIKELEKVRGEMEKFVSISSEIEKMKNELLVVNSKVSEMNSFLKSLIECIGKGEVKLEDIEKIGKIETLEKKILEMEKNVKESLAKDLREKLIELEESNKKKLEEIAAIVEKRIIQNRAPVGAISAQVDELIDKVINLESKIAVLEKAIRERKQPMVLE